MQDKSGGQITKKHMVCKTRRQVIAYEDECSQKDIPFVCVKNDRKYSTIEWDLIGLSEESRPRHYTAQNRIIEKYVREALFSIFRKYSTNKSQFDFSVCVGWFRKMPREIAAQRADEIFDLFMGMILKRRP